MNKLKIFISIIGIYLAHTTPLYFLTFALPTMLRSMHVSLTTIGLMGFLMLPWVLKFLWAPWVDRFYSVSFGKRRSWILPTQFFIMTLLFSLLWISPIKDPLCLFGILMLLSFFAATQDVASGAYVIEQCPSDERQKGNYAQVIGTTLGSASGGALILFCYGMFGWKFSLLLILTLAIIFFVVLIFIREKREICVISREIPSLKHFFRHENARRMLWMCLAYRGCEGLVMGMQQPFLVDLHIPIDRIGLVMGVGNLTIGLFAAYIASIILKPLGNARMLGMLGLIRSAAYFGLFIVAFYQIHATTFIFTVVIVNMATRLMEMVTLYTIFMAQCSSKQAATDFAIFVSAELMIYMLGISLSGYLAEIIGFTGLFLLGSFLSFISVMVSLRIYSHVNRSKIEPIPDKKGLAMS